MVGCDPGLIVWQNSKVRKLSKLTSSNQRFKKNYREIKGKRMIAQGIFYGIKELVLHENQSCLDEKMFIYEV